MKRYHVWKRMALCLSLILLLAGSALTAFAYEPLDTERNTSLTVYIGRDNTGFSGAVFRLYRVGDVSRWAEFSLAGDFVDYPVSLDGLDSDGWRSLSQTLDGYVTRDGLEPLRSGMTGEDGKAVFQSLNTGLYLVIGERFSQDNTTYTPESFLISLPTLNATEDTWLYEPMVSCKYEMDTVPEIPEQAETVSLTALKVWQDAGYVSLRPEEITVQLLKDDQVYETVSLKEENGWRHTWTELDAKARWRVAEGDIPEGYTVSASREGDLFTITNTYKRSPGGGGSSGGGGGSSSGGGSSGGGDNYGPGMEIPDEPVSRSDAPNLPGVDIIMESMVPLAAGPERSSILPQTGMLWWPVPLLAGGGLVLFLIGWGKNRYEDWQN